MTIGLKPGRFITAIYLALALAGERGLAQLPEQSDDKYIGNIFESRIGELPRMGWFAPPYGFVVQDDAPAVFFYAPVGMPLTGKKKGTVSATDAKSVRTLYGEACEIGDTDHLTAFDVGAETDDGRALYTTKKLPGETRSGLVTIPLDRNEMTSVNRLLKWPDQGTLRRDEAIGVRAQSFFYSLNKLYKPATGLLSEEAIVLHGRNGQILAHELHTELDAGQPCDGCGIPRYAYPGSGLYNPLNMFELTGFAYPLLLLDTSTFEGRALTLLTFTPDGMATDFRVYEYVINCR